MKLLEVKAIEFHRITTLAHHQTIKKDSELYFFKKAFVHTTIYEIIEGQEFNEIIKQIKLE